MSTLTFREVSDYNRFDTTTKHTPSHVCFHLISSLTIYSRQHITGQSRAGSRQEDMAGGFGLVWDGGFALKRILVLPSCACVVVTWNSAENYLIQSLRNPSFKKLFLTFLNSKTV
jgi:hypothetical protein